MSHTETMTPRERMRCALNHEEADRVPIDLGGFQTGIHKRAYEELIAHMDVDDSEAAVLDPVQQLAVPCEEVLKRFHVDTRYIVAHGPDSFTGGIEVNERDGRLWHDLRDEFGVVWSMPDDQQLYMDISHHPLAEADIAGVERHPFPKGDDPSRFSGVREKALALRDGTDYALCTGIGGVVYETCWYMRGLERWFMDMIENPSFCEAVLDRMLTFWTGYYTEFMKAVGDCVDVVMIGDDLAGQHGPLFSPDFYRKIVKPRQKALVQHIRSLTDAKIWYHTCGACREYIPELIDNGVDILNPVQIGLPGMDPESLKKEFGDRIVFWGGSVDAQHLLPFKGPKEIDAAVKENLGVFMPRGGYVFNNVHNIQYGVPAENVVALYEAGYEHGWY